MTRLKGPKAIKGKIKASAACLQFLLINDFPHQWRADTNPRAIANCCIAYTSTAEMIASVKAAMQELQTETPGNLQPIPADNDQVLDALEKHMYTFGCPPLDLLIRTSDTHRLSDFLLWQCHQDTSLVFVKKLWPELGIPDALAVLLEWRWKQKRRARQLN